MKSEDRELLRVGIALVLVLLAVVLLILEGLTWRVFL
jgi:hypothetical protein